MILILIAVVQSIDWTLGSTQELLDRVRRFEIATAKSENLVVERHDLMIQLLIVRLRR
ncbi:MAG: hypothetical protein PVJ43_03690 [Gemmatimonadales bacterium]